MVASVNTAKDGHESSVEPGVTGLRRDNSFVHRLRLSSVESMDALEPLLRRGRPGPAILLLWFLDEMSSGVTRP